MLSIGICDDQRESRLQLRWQLETILEERQIRNTLYEFSSGETLLAWMERHPYEIDLLFLDIEMGDVSGMETARRLRAWGNQLQIVFVTGFSDYVFDGYGVDALGYLMKPARREQVEAMVERTLTRLCRDAERVYACRSGETWYRIPHGEILYFVSDRRKVRCVTDGRRYDFYGKLDEVERELAGAGFLRIHQRYLVRIGAVRQVWGSEVQVGEETLPISRSCRQEVLLALTRSTLGG